MFVENDQNDRPCMVKAVQTMTARYFDHFMRYLCLFLYIDLVLGTNAQMLTETRPSDAQSDGRLEAKSSVKMNSSDNASQAAPMTEASACSIYMAPSTISGSGMGVFTAKTLREGQELSTAEAVLPVVKTFRDIPLLNEYLFTGRYVDDSKASSFVMGMGSVMNSHLGLVNIGLVGPRQHHHNRAEPSHGSSTNFHDMRYQVMFDLPAGTELFDFYGNHWFDLRPELDNVPRTTDYYMAEELLQQFLPMSASDSDLRRRLSDLLATLPNDSRVRVVIPDDPLQARRIAEEGFRVVLQEDHKTTVQELEQNGRCLDSIEAKKSDMLHAGKGAFAKANIAAGSIVTGSPLIHLADGMQWLQLQHEQWNPAIRQYELRQDNVAQLLLNYCFGHEHSTLLLCPYGNVGLFNHNHQAPNVRIQWSPHGEINHNSTVLGLPLSELQNIPRVSLAVDYVALRDIDAGEELVIDYGEAWEAVWRSHAHRWQPLPERSAHEFNIQGPMVIRTEDEQEDNPYPPNIEFRCHPEVIGELFVVDHVDWFDAFGRPIGSPCQILDRRITRSSILYSIRLRVDEDDWKVVENVGRQYIRFADVPHDLHHDQAFRHPMHLPDDMFPQQWRNI